MVTVSFELRGLDQLGNQMQSLVGKLAEGVREQTEAVRQAWLERIEQEGTLGAYAHALAGDVIEYPVGGDPLYGRVVITDPAAVKLEEGMAPRELSVDIRSA